MVMAKYYYFTVIYSSHNDQQSSVTTMLCIHPQVGKRSFDQRETNRVLLNASCTGQELVRFALQHCVWLSVFVRQLYSSQN